MFIFLLYIESNMHIYLTKNIKLFAALSSSLLAALVLWRYKFSKSVEDVKKVKCKGHRKTVAGLINAGNSCFMNSLLQGLTSSTNFVKWIKCSTKKFSGDEQRSYFACSLYKLMRLLSNKKSIPSAKYHDASELLDDICARGWEISSEQQDAHEFMQVVMSTLEEEKEHYNTENQKYLPSFNDIMLLDMKTVFSTFTKRNPFNGKMITQLSCQRCKCKLPHRSTDFYSISAPLPQMNYTKLTIQDCLKNFFKEETLENVDCEFCSNNDHVLGDMKSNSCVKNQNNNIVTMPKNTISNKVENRSKSAYVPQHLWNFNQQMTRRHAKPNIERTLLKSNFTKKEWIGKLPDSLCIHLQRLVWSLGMPMKRSDFVEFPDILDMSEYCYFNAIKPQDRILQNKTIQKTLENLKNPKLQNLLKERLQNRGLRGGSSEALNGTSSNSCSTSLAKYELTAVIVHLGGWSFSGHFICYRKISGIEDNIKFSKWLHISDSSVRFARKEEVLSSPAYMLFYERQKLHDM